MREAENSVTSVRNALKRLSDDRNTYTSRKIVFPSSLETSKMEH